MNCNKILCDYCNSKQIDLYLFTVPCGYLVCYSHLQTEHEIFKCFICKDHMIYKQACFEITKNRKKLEKITIIDGKKRILNLCDQVDEFKLDPESFMNSHLSELANKIDLRREVLKSSMIKSIDKYYEFLLNDVKEHKIKYSDLIRIDFESINTEEMREQISSIDENCVDNQLNKEIMSNLNLDEYFKNFDEFKIIQFFEGEKLETLETDLCELFGRIDSKKSNKSSDHSSINSKTKSNEFELIAKVGISKIEQLSTGELVYTLQSDPSNLIIFDLENNQIKEIKTGIYDIKFLFKSSKDEIITIDSEFHVKIWLDYKILSTYDIIKNKMLYINLKDDTIIFMTDERFVTKLNYFNGEILNHFFLNKNDLDLSIVKCDSNLFFSNNGRYPGLYKFDETGYLKASIENHMGMTKLTVLKDLNKNKCFAGTASGEIIILETNKYNDGITIKLRKNCHSLSIASILSNYDGYVVSICLGGQIKVWKEEKLELVDQVSVKNPIYARYLKNGKIAYIDLDFNFYINF